MYELRKVGLTFEFVPSGEVRVSELVKAIEVARSKKKYPALDTLEKVVGNKNWSDFIKREKPLIRVGKDWWEIAGAKKLPVVAFSGDYGFELGTGAVYTLKNVPVCNGIVPRTIRAVDSGKGKLLVVPEAGTFIFTVEKFLQFAKPLARRIFKHRPAFFKATMIELRTGSRGELVGTVLALTGNGLREKFYFAVAKCGARCLCVEATDGNGHFDKNVEGFLSEAIGLKPCFEVRRSM